MSLAQARKLVASGKAVVDVSRTRYAIRERFRQHGLGNTKHHAEETFDHYNTHVVIDPDTRMFVCPANPPSEHAIRRAKELLREAGRKQDAAAMDRQRVRMAEISLGMRPRMEIPLAGGMPIG